MECLLRGTTWIFKGNSGPLSSLKVNTLHRDWEQVLITARPVRATTRYGLDGLGIESR
jgi:hypothetical protein